jgi:xanthine dehydrogenase accessory factor
VLASVGFLPVACDDDETGALATPPSWAHRVVSSFELTDIEREVGALGVGDYVVIATRDHAIDQRILERLLTNETLSYLGLIGSRGKIGRFRKRLAAKGVATEERWQRLHAPIGLDISAETPAEIAVSVAAELVRIRNRGRY